MNAQREKTINGHKIQEYYWNSRLVVYIDNKKFEGSFDEAIKMLNSCDVSDKGQ